MISAVRPSAEAAAPVCSNPKALGVSRVVEIDTAGGPRFGQQQYQDNDILQDGEVVLTFDDGPLRPYSQPVINALAEHCTLATFFMVGRMAASDPAMVKEIARRGHTIGTHTWSHQNLRAMLPPRARTEVELGFSAVKRAAGQDIAPFFRFPFLGDSRAMTAHLKSRNLAIFSIDADGYDYKTQNPEDVHRAIINQITYKKKGIILFHDIQPSTARALRGILDDLKRRGFRVVHMVPKVAAATLAEFDGMAAKGVSQAQVDAGGPAPVSQRAVVAPIAGSRAPGSETRPQSVTASPLPPAATGPVAAQPGPAAGAALPAPRAIARRPADDDNWQARAFRY